MKRLPNKKLTTQELDLLIEDNLYDYGGEAIICTTNNPHSVYKIFVYPGTNIPDRMSDNKLRKVSYYYQNDITGLIKPLSTLENNGDLIGYETTFDSTNTSLLDSLLTPSEIFSCLNQSKDILEYLATKDITYGDVTSDNLLVNARTKKVTFCDIDNTRVGEYPIDVMSDSLSNYVFSRRAADSTIDAYMHNLLTLEQLYFRNASYTEIVRKLRAGQNPIEADQLASRIITSMQDPPNFTGEYVLPYIKQKR